MDDTIFAVSSGNTVSAISVIRISGALSQSVLQVLGKWDGAGRVKAAWLHDPMTNERLDEGLLLWFPGPRSATGEDVAELQIHGSQAVRTRVIEALGRIPGLRSADPGEFTRRALLNGRLDLSQAEGLADLLAAETIEQHRQAIRQFGGSVAVVADGWRRRLISALALVETEIDFVDEELPDQRLAVVQILSDLRADLARESAASVATDRLRGGFEVAIVGRPNAGKSTLLNALARREVALTSDEAGTTRDVLELRLDLAGLPVTFLDTAGIRDDAVGIEARGVSRARDRAEGADLRVFLVDDVLEVSLLGVAEANDDLVVRAKADLREAGGLLGVSGLTGLGLDTLIDEIVARLRSRNFGTAALVGQRQREAAVAAEAALGAAVDLLTGEDAPELVAEELRVALSAIDRLTGRTEPDSVLDEVFSRFCIGK